MRCIGKLFIVLCVFVSTFYSVSAQEVVLGADTLTVYFRVSSHRFDPSYMGNGKNVDEFFKRVSLHKPAPGSLNFKELDFEVTSSPEGSYEFNRSLSQRRIQALRKFIQSHAVLQDSLVTVSHFDEAWNELDSKLMDSDVPWRDDVIDIIEQNPQVLVDERGNLTEPRKNALKAYRGGEPWRYMVRNWFPEMRKFTVVVLNKTILPDLGDVVIDDDASVPYERIVFEDTMLSVPLMPTWSRNITLKTNTIGWGMGHANVACEVDLAPHWSISLPFYYSGGFDYFTSTLKFRGIVIQPEARYYFNENDGLYVGAHVGVGWYNFALNGEYRVQDHDGTRPAWGGGLGVGYSFQFKRRPRWGMEFAIGAGVYDVKYDLFYNEPNGPYAEVDVHNTFVGIDNASVTFTYRFFHKRKEGRL